FKELTTAYEVLRNPQARANYDRYGDPRGMGGRAGGDPFAGFGDLSDLIDAFFGGGFGGSRTRGRSGPRPGRDAIVDVVLTLEEAAEGVRRDLDVEPDTAIAASCPALPAGTSPQTRARDLERELRLLGPVNPLALEELTALEERHAFVEEQLDDVKKTRRELGKVIRAVDAEMTELLSAAVADVADNFSRLFETLFPGGTGRLRLTDAETVLQAGIEVEAQPAGKNVRRLSLLSGGERSLVALAFLFAVFRSRPSPFYLLDEVEAALDDVNLHRFLHLLDEFRDHSQLVVVSHQKRTMEAADALYGVTMQPGGSSRVVSERVRRAREAEPVTS
ncbi:MAG: AAA family ATPase, partial [Actinomycetota bacterium]|nr:AAA family ATPase [Actinomycetota bacterium]